MHPRLLGADIIVELAAMAVAGLELYDGSGHEIQVRRSMQVSPKAKAIHPGGCVLPKKRAHGRAQQTSITPKTAGWFEKYPLCRAVACAEAFGFRLSRITGSHHIYVHVDIPELVNLQNVNGQAKLYQVKQLLRLIERYNLQMEDGP